MNTRLAWPFKSPVVGVLLLATLPWLISAAHRHAELLGVLSYHSAAVPEFRRPCSLDELGWDVDSKSIETAGLRRLVMSGEYGLTCACQAIAALGLSADDGLFTKCGYWAIARNDREKATLFLRRVPHGSWPLIRRGRAVASEFGWKYAAPWMHAAVMVDSTLADSWEGLGDAQLFGTEEPIDAISSFSRAITLAPHKHYLYSALAHAHLMARQPLEALHAIKRLQDLEGSKLDAQSLSILGNAQLLLGRTQDAAGSLASSLLLRPNDAWTWQSLGVASCRLGLEPEAASAWARAVALDFRVGRPEGLVCGHSK